MATLTKISHHQLADWLPQYGVGELTDYQRISTGIENSNYFVNTNDHEVAYRWVVTILEQNYPSRELLVPLADRLQRAGLPVPRIVANNAGESVVTLAGKPAILSTCLPGHHPVNPTVDQCMAVGRFLARFHQASAGARVHAKLFDRDLNWLALNSNKVSPYLPFNQQALLKQALAHLRSMLNRRDLSCLPTGVVHGDLFRDNVLFTRNGLSGVLDFHHSGEHYLLFDIAVAINDWCTDGTGMLDTERTVAFLRAYNNERKLAIEELWFLPLFMIYGATAFWLSRLRSQYPPPLQAAEAQKNPEEFRAIVQQRCAQFFYLDARLLSPSG